MSYSRRHYRMVSPPKDTPEQVAWRLRDNRARDLAGKDQDAKYPVITPENFYEARDYFEERRAYHHDELRKEAS